jgi:hypothetical protein
MVQLLNATVVQCYSCSILPLFHATAVQAYSFSKLPFHLFNITAVQGSAIQSYIHSCSKIQLLKDTAFQGNSCSKVQRLKNTAAHRLSTQLFNAVQ